MKNFLLLFFVLFCNNYFLQGQDFKRRQHALSVGMGSGIILLFGDIGNMGKGYNFNIQSTYSVVQDWSVRGSLIYGSVSDSDEGTPNAGRDYAYETTLLQPSVQVAYTFIRVKEKGYTRKGLLRYWDRWKGYVIGGVAFTSFKIHPSRHLTPEVLTKQQGLAIAVPFGAALQYSISEKLSLSGTLMPQFFFSDNLDGYASPYSKSNDFVYLTSITLVYKLSK